MGEPYSIPRRSIRGLRTAHLRIQGIVRRVAMNHGASARRIEALEVELHRIAEVGDIAHVQKLLEVILSGLVQRVFLPAPIVGIHHSHVLVVRSAVEPFRRHGHSMIPHECVIPLARCGELYGASLSVLDLVLENETDLVATVAFLVDFVGLKRQRASCRTSVDFT